MGPSGFPFPPYLSKHAEDEFGSPVIRASSLSSPLVLSPDVNEALSPSNVTPGDGREVDILPSVVSPFSGAGFHLNATAFSTRNLQELGCRGERKSHRVSQNQQSLMFSQPSQAMTLSHSLPTPPHEKRPILRLPSFSELGIASCKLMNQTAQAIEPLPPNTAMVTPPEDSLENTLNPNARTLPELGGGGAPLVSQVEPTVPLPTGLGSVEAEPTAASKSEKNAEFLKSPMDAILNRFQDSNSQTRSIRVLSHALPSPTVPGHCFPWILESVKNGHMSSSLTWISHLHAVPQRFNLSDLPTSPPSTPGIPFGSNDGTSEDYFAIKTFESAVEAMDYSSFSGGLTIKPAAGSPRSSFQQELAAPASLDLIVVERYIPPPSEREFASLFSLSKPSLLVDRLYELVPGNGCVIFVYPTKTGAQTFCDRVLGPVIDPLLRSMAVVKGFSSSLIRALGTMAAVPQMYEFESLKYNMIQICEEIQRSSTSNLATRMRLRGNSANFSLIWAEKKYVTLSREVWSDWWIKQEKVRIRRDVYQHLRHGISETMPIQLTQEIFDGINNRPYPAGQEPTDAPIEVGVFVIARND